MVAISVISACNNNCKYCFQQDHYHKLNLMMSYKDFEDVLAWSKGAPRISLLGGEPTLHPDIVKMAKRVHDEFTLVMLSNLCGETEVYEKILEVAPESGWLINTTTRDELLDLFEENIKYFQKKGKEFSAGITLMHDEELDTKFSQRLVRLGKQYPDVVKRYRLGLATPFHRERIELLCYDEPVLKFCELAKKETPDIEIGFDCPTNMCQITPKTMGILMDDYNVDGIKITTHCNTVVDIAADKSVKYCASVPDDLLITKSYKAFQNWMDCEQFLMGFKENYMQQFGYMCREQKRCSNEICSGICLAMAGYMRKQQMEEEF